ncbi:von Willebrand factor type A domain-containing protein [Zhouia sp. PK063]|uniref:vWA domain-containing protein n=1 Tax=Zhouia sp. PK063 TaxID=3373602 RepID=UPI00378F84A1
MKKILLLWLLTCTATFAQELTINGNVVDESNKPLPGVNVAIKGKTTGTVTDFDGNFSIKTQKNTTLIFSYIGYNAKMVLVKNNKFLKVALQPSSTSLDEVVITGYGTERKMSRTGSVSQVLQGKTSGIRIRGMNSVSKIGYLTNFQHPANTESYKEIEGNTFKNVQTSPLSTFSIDVDKAAYSNIRRMINNGQKVPKDAVKIEEMINYFTYNYQQPTGDDPFSIQTDIAVTPWNEQTKLVRIGLQGKTIPNDDFPASNLVFLVDVSGSMNSPNKLPLLKSAFKLLVNQLRSKDRVSIVVYAGAAGVVLNSTSGKHKQKIIQSLNNLNAGGSTAGGAGIKLAYKIARENFIHGGNNRVVLATDGDFNVGASSDKDMETLIKDERDSGVFLTCLGFGMGNYKDSKLERLADKGNGNHAYIDSMQEAQKVLGTEFGGTLYTIAKDVKIQVEFNPAKVQAYRLIGYENRLLNDEDFNDDKKDAGELGSGHTVTALYEIIPVGVKSKFLKDIDDLKYTKNTVTTTSDELLTVKFRYKKPDGNTSKLITKTLNDDNFHTTEDFDFASAVALFGMQLRKSKYANKASFKKVISLAEAGRGKDDDGYRAEFIRLVKSYEKSR